MIEPIQAFAVIGFMGILAHVLKSWVDWRDVRNAADLTPILDEWARKAAQNFFPLCGFMEEH